MAHAAPRHRRFVIAVLLLALAGWVRGTAWGADPPVPPPAATGKQWSLVLLPDSQGYNQTYDMGGKFQGRGFQYQDRWPKQIAWAAANRERFNIRFVSSVGDHVQNHGFDPAQADADATSPDAKRRQEWRNAVAGVNLLHQDGDPDRPALIPYALAIGNHDYHSGDKADATSTEYEQYLGPGRMRGADGRIKPGVAGFYRGDDRGWEHRKDGAVVATGAGRNSWQIFEGGGREFLHLTLECGVSDGAIAWAKDVLAAQPRLPVIVTTHAFLEGGGQLRARAGMGRVYEGANPSNGAEAIFERLIKQEDRIFLILCGHTWFRKHQVLQNARGQEVHVQLMCLHLDRVGGRIDPAELPPDSPFRGPADLDRNGSGWLALLVFDPEAKKIRGYTYSPVIDVWATDRAADYKGTTFPVGEDIVEEFAFDFEARFGPAPARTPAQSPRTPAK